MSTAAEGRSPPTVSTEPPSRQLGSGLERAVRMIVATRLDVRPARVTRDARFVEALGADSLDLLGVVMEVEEQLQIEIPDDEVERLRTLGDILGYLNSGGVGTTQCTAISSRSQIAG